MQLLITIKQPFRVWVSVVSAASAFVVKSSDNIVEANIPTSSKSDRVERLIAGSRGDRIPSYFQRSQFPLHPSSPRCSLWVEYPLREEDESPAEQPHHSDYASLRAFRDGRHCHSRRIRLWEIAAGQRRRSEAGGPVAAELRSSDDRDSFRRWFAYIAEMQFYKLSGAWNEDQRDCAGLVRF